MFTKVIRAALLGASISLFLSASAFAQSTVLVVDTQKVLADSKVGKYVASQLQNIESSMTSEIKAKANPLESKSKSFGTQYDGRKLEDLKNDAAFKSQYSSLQKDQAELQQEIAFKQRELGITKQKAIIPVLKKVKEVIDQVARERNANVVLDRGEVLYVSGVDVTSTIVARLDSQMTSTSVVRERLPRK